MSKSRNGRPLPMDVLLLPFLFLAFFRPFEEPAQTVVEVLYLCVLLGIIVCEASRDSDEVEVLAARNCVATGTDAVVEAPSEVRFYVLPHPEVAEPVRRRGEYEDLLLHCMPRLRRRSLSQS